MKRLAVLVLAAGVGAGATLPASQAPAGLERIAAQALQALRENRPQDAIRLYREGVRLKPAWGDGWWALGTLYYEQDRYPECRDALSRLTALDAKAGAAWTMRGLCEFETRQYELSLAHLQRGRELGSGNAQIAAVAQYHLAALLSRCEQYEQSMELLIGLARQGRGDPATVEATGIAALRKPILPGQVAEAEREMVYLAGEAVRDAAAARPADARAAFGALLARYAAAPGVHYLYATYLLMAGEADQALGEFKQELAVSPQHVPARVQIALEYLKRDEPASALPYARDAARLMPASFAARMVLGKVLVGKGDAGAGIQELQMAAQLDPANPQPHFSLASAYSGLGRKDDAAREQREFLRLKAARR